MKTMWTEKEAEHYGKFFDFDPVLIDPKPVSLTVGAQSARHAPAFEERPV
jgi:hypothetical protein